jgi:hypothetical protein
MAKVKELLRRLGPQTCPFLLSQIIPDASVRHQQLLGLGIPCVGQVVLPGRYREAARQLGIAENSSVMRGALPSSKNIAELPVEGADSEDILGQVAFPIPVRGHSFPGNPSIEVSAIQSAQTVLEEGSETAIFRNAFGQGIVRGTLAYRVLIEVKQGGQNFTEGSVYLH